MVGGVPPVKVPQSITGATYCRHGQPDTLTPDIQAIYSHQSISTVLSLLNYPTETIKYVHYATFTADSAAMLLAEWFFVHCGTKVCICMCCCSTYSYTFVKVPIIATGAKMRFPSDCNKHLTHKPAMSSQLESEWV